MAIGWACEFSEAREESRKEKKMTRLVWVLAALCAVCPLVSAQTKPPVIPAWDKVGKGMKLLTTTEGFWNLYVDKQKPPQKMLVEVRKVGTPFLLATSIAGGTTRAGWQWNDWYLMFRKHGNKLVLLERNARYVAKGDKRVSEAVKRTYTDRVLATYRIVGRGPKGGDVIDGRGFFASGATMFFGGIGRSRDASLATFSSPGSFPGNTELSVTMPDRSGKLIRLHYSISALPKTGYKPRKADTRVGFFTTVLKDFSQSNKDDRRNLRYINRWQLEKLDSKLAISPPKKPIEFYIEKTVPVRFRRYVREGILEWNKAFAKLGYDNAVVVHQQTDTRYNDLAPEDVRWNFFRWIYSDSPFAMGPSRVHPETGQILDADIIFDDSYIRFTLQEYRLQIRQLPAAITGRRGREYLKQSPIFSRLGLVPAADEFFDAIPDNAARPNLRPHARRAFCSHGQGVQHQIASCGLILSTPPVEGTKGPLPEAVLGEFVKDTVMHEVGHTLGLRHNFKASIFKTNAEVHGDKKPGVIAGSVMDYNPIMIAPKGQVQGAFAMTSLGPYDYWAIEYGYTAKDADLKKVVARCAEKGLDYGTDEDTLSNDPLINRWDMGTDPMEFAKNRIKLMRQIRKDLEARAVDKGEGYNRLRRAVNMQLIEARSAGSLVVRFVGGEYLHRDHRGDPNARPPLVPVAGEKQREALKFICEELLDDDYYQFEPEFLQKLAPDLWGEDFLSLLLEGYGYPYLDNVLRIQLSLVYGLTGPDRLSRVLGAARKTPKGQDFLTAPDIFDALEAAIFGDLAKMANTEWTNKSPAISTMRRNLQREYVAHLTGILLTGERYYPPQIQTLVRHYVSELADKIDASRSIPVDTYTEAHLDECRNRLKRALEASYARMVR